MARVRLASWWDGHAPGDVVEVEAEQVAPLRRDGRVVDVLDVPPAPPALVKAEPAPEPEPEHKAAKDDQEQADSSAPKRRRK